MFNKKDKREDTPMQSALITQDEITKQKDPGFWREVWQQVRLVSRLLRDPEVPFYFKIVPFLGFVYVLMPIDIIPDMFLVMGQLDDLTALIVGAKVFIELAPQHVVARHMQEIRIQDGYDVIVEGEYVEQLDEAIVIDPDSGKTIVQKEPEDLK